MAHSYDRVKINQEVNADSKFTILKYISLKVNPRLTPSEAAVLHFIYMRTVWWGKLSERISVNQFLNGIISYKDGSEVISGLNMSRGTLRNCLSSLARKKIILAARTWTKAGGDAAKEYMINIGEDYETMLKTPKSDKPRVAKVLATPKNNRVFSDTCREGEGSKSDRGEGSIFDPLNIGSVKSLDLVSCAKNHTLGVEKEARKDSNHPRHIYKDTENAAGSDVTEGTLISFPEEGVSFYECVPDALTLPDKPVLSESAKTVLARIESARSKQKVSGKDKEEHKEKKESAPALFALWAEIVSENFPEYSVNTTKNLKLLAMLKNAKEKFLSTRKDDVKFSDFLRFCASNWAKIGSIYYKNLKKGKFPDYPDLWFILALNRGFISAFASDTFEKEQVMRTKYDADIASLVRQGYTVEEAKERLKQNLESIAGDTLHRMQSKLAVKDATIRALEERAKAAEEAKERAYLSLGRQMANGPVGAPQASVIAMPKKEPSVAPTAEEEEAMFSVEYENWRISS